MSWVRFFCHANGCPVVRSQFTAVLTKCTAASQLCTGLITSHSFRIGRATQLAAAGAQWRYHANGRDGSLGRTDHISVDGHPRAECYM